MNNAVAAHSCFFAPCVCLPLLCVGAADNALGPTGWTLCTALPPKLRHLDLSGTCLGDGGMASIVPSLAAMRGLRTLNLARACIVVGRRLRPCAVEWACVGCRQLGSLVDVILRQFFFASAVTVTDPRLSIGDG